MRRISVWLKGMPERGWDSRGHFFAAAAESMRRILVDNARRKQAGKHGGGHARCDLDESLLAVPEPAEDLLALDEALDKLAAIDKVKSDLVKLRYFAGLTIDQAASALGISTTSADRYWAYARAWLHQEISGGATFTRARRDQNPDGAWGNLNVILALQGGVLEHPHQRGEVSYDGRNDLHRSTAKARSGRTVRLLE